MRFVSFLLCLFALSARAMQTYRRSGNPVYPAVITGFHVIFPKQTNEWCNFTVRYQMNDQAIDAVAIESAPYTELNQKKYFGKEVEVFVSEKNPYLVSIKGNHCLDLPCGILLVIGLFGILFF